MNKVINKTTVLFAVMLLFTYQKTEL